MKELFQYVLFLLGDEVSVYLREDNSDWIFYGSVYGFVDGEYFDICFRHHRASNEPEIAIAYTTEDPEFFMDLLKK